MEVRSESIGEIRSYLILFDGGRSVFSHLTLEFPFGYDQ